MPRKPAPEIPAVDAFRSRIKGLAVLPVARIVPDPNNFRQHPERQRGALRAVLRDLGTVAAVLVRPAAAPALRSLRKVPRGDAEAFGRWLASYRAGFVLVDGHLRVDEAGPDGTVESLVLDLDAREAAEALATFDAVGDMAEIDREAFARNAALFSSTEPDVQALVADLARIRVAEEREAAAIETGERKLEERETSEARIDVDPSEDGEDDSEEVPASERSRISEETETPTSFEDAPSPSASDVLSGAARWCVVEGDSLAVLRGLPDACIDALICDPPYSSGGQYRGDRSRPTTEKYVGNDVALRRPEFAGDNRDQRSFVAWCALWLSECQRLLKPGAPVCLFTDWRQLPATTDALQAGGFVWRGIVPWDKTEATRPVMGRFRTQAEYVVWGSNGPMPTERGVGVLPGVCRIPVRPDDKHHETGKPTELMRRVNAICEPGGTILDPFFGSGSTGAAALLDGFRIVGIEKTSAYAAIARGRMAHVERQIGDRRIAGPSLERRDESETEPATGRHPLAIVLSNAEKRRWDARKAELGARDDRSALVSLLGRP